MSGCRYVHWGLSDLHIFHFILYFCFLLFSLQSSAHSICAGCSNPGSHRRVPLPDLLTVRARRKDTSYIWSSSNPVFFLGRRTSRSRPFSENAFLTHLDYRISLILIFSYSFYRAKNTTAHQKRSRSINQKARCGDRLGLSPSGTS